jgi:hypothetical protein
MRKLRARRSETDIPSVTTKRLLTVSGLALALATASCGGQPFPETRAKSPTSARPAVTPTTPHARLLASVPRATDARTARLSMTETISEMGTAGTFNVTGTGVIDLARRRMMMTMQERSGGESLSQELRVVGGTAYVKVDGEWLSMSFGLAETGTADPSSYLDFLQGVSDVVRVDGHDILRGDATTRYRATLNLDRALTRGGTTARQSALRRVIDQLGHINIPVTVWVDDSGRLRKMRMSIDLAALATRLGAPAGTKPKMDATIELYGFGAAVDVQVPPGAKSAAAAALESAAQSDLRNGLTAEKTIYVDQQMYSTDAVYLKQVEPSLDWGGKVSVVVNGGGAEPRQVVCLSEWSASGTVFAIADVAVGPTAGTYYGKGGCPPVVTTQNVTALGSGW